MKNFGLNHSLMERPSSISVRQFLIPSTAAITTDQSCVHGIPVQVVRAETSYLLVFLLIPGNRFCRPQPTQEVSGSPSAARSTYMPPPSFPSPSSTSKRLYPRCSLIFGMEGQDVSRVYIAEEKKRAAAICDSKSEFIPFRTPCARRAHDWLIHCEPHDPGPKVRSPAAASSRRQACWPVCASPPR